MPGPRGLRADQQRDLDVLERDHRVGGGDHAVQERECAVVQLHHHALQRLLRFLVGNLEHLQDHRLVLAEHFAARDPEKQAVADLAGGARHCDANGLVGHGRLPGEGPNISGLALLRSTGAIRSLL